MSNTVHVATDGSDENDGSSEAPFRTITAALDAANEGDTIMFATGVYEPEPAREHQIHTAHLRLIVARSQLLHSGYSEDIIREAIRRLRDE